MILLRPSPYSTSLARHSSPHDPLSITSMYAPRPPVRHAVRGRRASATRHQSSHTVRPIHQQWCIDLHLRVFTLRKNFWSPASSPQTVCKRLVSTSSFHLSSKLWKQSHLGTSVWADLSGAVNSSPRRTCPYPGASERWKAYTVGLVPFLQPSQ